jgi:hypothetical protein
VVGTISNPWVTVQDAAGKLYTFEIGRECQLKFSAATGANILLATIGNIGIQKGDTLTVTYSPYVVNNRTRALVIQ